MTTRKGSSDRHGLLGATITIVTGLVLAGWSVPADAALTTPACLAKKLKQWGDLRKCQAVESGKALQGKPADPEKCRTKLNDKMAKLNAVATAASVACRFEPNTIGGGVVIDYDTGLMWTRTTDIGSVTDADERFSWSAQGMCEQGLSCGSAFLYFLGFLNACPGCLWGYYDWRLPSVAELEGILDMDAPGCGSGSPCINQAAFGPAPATWYWTGESFDGFFAQVAWVVDFETGETDADPKYSYHAVRAVRSAL